MPEKERTPSRTDTDKKENPVFKEHSPDWQDGLYLQAKAKVNLALLVTGHQDGLHELDMLNAPISLYDELWIEPSDRDEIISDFYLPESNTITKALKALKENGLQGNYRITLKKHIPEQAGLGGGSADAAALLKGVNEWKKLGLDEKALMKIGFSIGADVPTCLYERPARVKGAGQFVEPVIWDQNRQVLLVKPDFGIPTGPCFARYDELTSINEDTRAAKAQSDRGEILQELLERDWDGFVKNTRNDLELAAFAMEPRLKRLKEILEKKAKRVMMSGSGSTLIVFDEPENLKRLQEELQDGQDGIEKYWKEYKDDKDLFKDLFVERVVLA